MIRTSMVDDRGEIRQLTPNDPDYWTGPYTYVPYPKALYRITQPGQTDAECRVVNSDHEMSKLGTAWHESPTEAKEAFEKLESDVAKAAAESNYADRNLSAGAAAERLAHDRSTDEMITDVPVPKKRGRPFKKQATVSTD